MCDFLLVVRYQGKIHFRSRKSRKSQVICSTGNTGNPEFTLSSISVNSALYVFENAINCPNYLLGTKALVNILAKSTSPPPPFFSKTEEISCGPPPKKNYMAKIKRFPKNKDQNMENWHSL